MFSDTENILELADALYRKGSLEESRKLLEGVVENHPGGYPDVYNRLGEIHYTGGRMEDAVRCFEQAVGANPAYTEACLNLAVAYNELGRYEEAEEVFRDAAGQVQTENDGPVIDRIANRHVGLGDDYARLDRLDDALHEFRRALTLRPRYVDVVCKVGMVLRRQEKLDDALRVFAHAKSLNPELPLPYVQTGQIYFRKGFHAMAIAEWQKALELDPSRRDAEALLATVRRSLMQT
ncbi:MAG: tetratricopeptide repeat protein [Nitrospirota bacterium]|nr:tetratricopeptide repeat protein [Nitrospirota bacterium]